jgi:AcrR family transcriptional regulator
MGTTGAEMKSTAKKSRRGQVTRDKIIEVAKTLIALHGPDGFQLQTVTEILGITPPAIYNHFKHREDLVAHIAEAGGRQLAEHMRRQPGEDVLTSLRRNARRYVEFLAENPAHARIILWDMARRGTAGWRGLAATNIEVREHMREALRAAAAEGVIRPIRVEAYLQVLYIGSAAAVVWTDYHDSDAEQDAEGFVESLPFPKRSDAEVEQLKDEAEDLVVRLLSPHLIDPNAVDDSENQGT